MPNQPPVDLNHLEALAKAATPGPWEVEDDSYMPPGWKDAPRYRDNGATSIYADGDCESHPIADCSCNHSCRDSEQQQANAAFIAAANPQVVLALIEIVRQIPADAGELLGQSSSELMRLASIVERQNSEIERLQTREETAGCPIATFNGHFPVLVWDDYHGFVVGRKDAVTGQWKLDLPFAFECGGKEIDLEPVLWWPLPEIPEHARDR